MKTRIYMKEYRGGRQYMLVLLRKVVHWGVKGYEGFRIKNNGEEDDWFISERRLNQGLAEGVIVRFK